ncbi:MAG: DUF58 domain-containing protein, partial [Actinobacteria bacterium]|nr:DUF58 domain-containing protein [Actinomycetota bacterium]
MTRRGWLVLLGAAALSTAGRMLGLIELFSLAAGATALVGAAAVYARIVRFDLDATRQPHPARVYAGQTSRVELTLVNRGARRSPVIVVRDPFDRGRRWARFLLAPLQPGQTARAAYRLPTDRRGVFEIGPLTAHLRDPFGLAEKVGEAAPATKLTVYPKVVPIEPLPHTLGHDPHAGADHPTALGRGGEDFYALREYQIGDDLRRVHWKSVARTGELMIRQDEMPWQGRATVVLDLRLSVHDAVSLERAISAAASVVSACWQHRSLVRLASTDGTDSGFAAGHGHVDAILEYLASADVERSGGLVPLVDRLRRDGNGGALAVITTAAATDGDLGAVGQLRGRFGALTLVVVESDGRATQRSQPGGAVIRVRTDDDFGPAWNQAMAIWRGTT